MAQADKPTAGLLQIPAAATQKTSGPAKKAHKPPAPRLKLLIRRLPPGLTQAELEGILGAEWKVGAGKVDWLQYKAGKVSKDPAKPSRPSRAYIHVVSSEHVTPLSDLVRQTSFQDARATSHDPILLGPPSLEFAPYAKIPGSRVRKDARQGTIDQDADFITFLESLTQPITKPGPADTFESEEKKTAVLTTPLVQFIKDKKASKAKEAAASKSSKHSRSEKEPKEKVQKKLLQRADKESSAVLVEKKGRGDKATKESTKAAKQAASTNKPGRGSTANTPKETTPAPERKRERGTVTAATKILQRDLGISPAGGRRRGKGANDTGSSKNDSSRDSSVPAPEGTKKESAAKAAKNAPSGSSSKVKKDTDSTTKATDGVPPPTSNTAPPKSNKGPKSKPSAPPASLATQAFLKHANPSQGVTEALLEMAFGAFGTVTKVEIDKKKGFGYVDFANPESLQQAMAASPVTVAQSQVVVLERKANPGGEKSRKGRGDLQQQQQSPAPPPPSGNAGNAGNTPNATKSSARGSRGGRGSRNKGPKGGAAAGDGEKEMEKMEKGSSGQ
ncbi:hypothetical protein N7486_003724 [Penicillium sp. IBT 16267x]|nr:hypothetical protein N7486_003724 [Penicillium sp. IBT 16267x]